MIERRSGRHTGQAIADAAGRLFLERGYARTTVRDIAAEAGADPALVIRHFGSKEQLFLETMRSSLDAQPLLEGPDETLGARFVQYLFEAGEQVRGVYLALVRASDAGEVGSQLRQVHERDFIAPLLTRMSGPDAELRARLAAAAVGGLLYSLWLVGDEELLGARSAVVERYGALLQRLITPPEHSA